MKGAQYTHKFCFMCKSYRGDFEYARRLSESFKKYNHDNLPMYIMVPPEDVGLFRQFSDDVISVLDESQFSFNFVFDDSILGIRPGYINQEIVKLSFWQTGLALNYFCIDSDSEFIRPFFLSDFMFSEDVPYSVLVEDHELKVDPEYYQAYWRGRAQYLDKIKRALQFTDCRSLTCHNNTTLNALVLKSFDQDFLSSKGWSYKDVLKIAPYEFSWYNFWLQKCNIIPVLQREPFFKMFHTKSQHLEYLRKGISKSDIARGYLGIIINSNYSRGYGVVDYEDVRAYHIPLLRRIQNKLSRFSISFGAERNR